MRILFFLPIILLWTQEILAQVSPVFQFESDQIIIQEENLPSDVALKVFKGKIPASEIPSNGSIIGKIEKSKSIVTFTPFVPFNLDQNYTLVYRDKISYFKIPIASDYQHLTIQSIFPSKTTLPANILKWYIQFSQPVNRANIYDHIHFYDANGTKIPRAILPLENALLNEAGTLLTIWIEPGRQKRGLGPNEKLGSVFEVGQQYSLVISKNLRDKNGLKMPQDLIHHFSTIENDRISPNAKKWKIESPKVNSQNTLQINFQESIDYGSALHAFKIINSTGEEISGHWSWTDFESTLLFTPKNDWAPDTYQIIVLTSIEDLAGNNLNRLFDGAVRRKNENSKFEVKLAFEVF